jgi:hypothetical protein
VAFAIALRLVGALAEFAAVDVVAAHGALAAFVGALVFVVVHLAISKTAA